MPDWLNTKTFNNPDIELAKIEQAKAYPELQRSTSKKIQELTDKLKGFTGAPEDGYAFELPDELEEANFKFDADNPYFKDFAEIAKQAGMNQDTFQNQMALAAKYIHNSEQSRVEYVNNAIESQMEAELEKLDKQTQQDFIQYVKVAGNLPGVTAEELNHFVDNLNDSSLVSTFNKIMTSTRSSNLPVNMDNTFDTPETLRHELKRIHSMPLGPDRDAAQNQLNERYRRMSYR